MEIKEIKILGKTKNQIVINDLYVFRLKLRKERLYHGSDRICLTAKRIAYTLKSISTTEKSKIFPKHNTG